VCNFLKNHCPFGRRLFVYQVTNDIYDTFGNEWRQIKISGDEPNGKPNNKEDKCHNS